MLIQALSVHYLLRQDIAAAEEHLFRVKSDIHGRKQSKKERKVGVAEPYGTRDTGCENGLSGELGLIPEQLVQLASAGKNRGDTDHRRGMIDQSHVATGFQSVVEADLE